LRINAVPLPVFLVFVVFVETEGFQTITEKSVTASVEVSELASNCALMRNVDKPIA
jgi:hypothetical protein